MKLTVYYSDPAQTASAGFGRVAHLPCIFDSRPGYHRLSSSYLLDRGMGSWNPVTRNGFNRGTAPTDQTMRNYAYWLVNFLEWAELRSIDLFECSYREHIQGRYQTEMLKGIWSRDGIPLSPRTINLRVQQACDFLLWLVDRGYRPSFDIPYGTISFKGKSAFNSTAHYAREINVRIGKVRQQRKVLRMPSDEHVSSWILQVYSKHGYSRGLMCETILLTGIRREEAACWRVETLPDIATGWHQNNINLPQQQRKVRVNIKFGCKGPCYGYDNGDKIGPEREIWIPEHLAVRLNEYRTGYRNIALKRWVNASVGLQAKKSRITSSVHLFIDDQSGRPLTARDVYDAWTDVELPIDGWSPHQGRHWWACSTLWMELKKHEKLRDFGAGTAAALMESTGITVLRFIIQPQLGHASDSTTMIYLQWAIDMIGQSLPILYESEIFAKNKPETDI